jgi:hypothetical protein
MDGNVPFFERERRQDSQLLQRLQNELAETKRLLEAQTRRQNDLEYVNEDLERRLEYEARERITLDAMKAEDEKRWEQERTRLEDERRGWEKKCEEESRRRAIVEERLRRSEKELYRMHQKKYDIEKAVRREESEKRKNEVYITRSMEKDAAAINSRQRSSQSNSVLSGLASSSAAASSVGSTNPSYLNVHPTMNPKDSKPSTVRTRQALSSAMDFFGLSSLE